LHELLNGRRLAVVAGEVKIHALAKRLGAEQCFEHAHDFGALLVDRRRVEIVDLMVEPGAHGMGQRTGVFHELVSAQASHVADALDRARARIGRELLIAKNREPFL
jgi:hypothetical protein